MAAVGKSELIGNGVKNGGMKCHNISMQNGNSHSQLHIINVTHQIKELQTVIRDRYEVDHYYSNVLILVILENHPEVTSYFTLIVWYVVFITTNRFDKSLFFTDSYCCRRRLEFVTS